MYMPIFSETNKYEVVASDVLVFFNEEKEYYMYMCRYKKWKKKRLNVARRRGQKSIYFAE